MSTIPIITVQEQYQKQIDALKNAAATTIDPCLVAKFIAASSNQVRELFFQKIASGYVFRKIYCSDRIGVPENKYIVFDFECEEGVLCLIPPAFMVVINIVDRYVVTIVDPYIPPSAVTTNNTPQLSPCGCDDKHPTRTAVSVASGQDKKSAVYDFLENADPSKSCKLLARTIDGTAADAIVSPGIVNNTFILIVKGKKPYLNMKVVLSPLTYVQEPEYWGIEVLGCVAGIVLPTVGRYDEFLPLDGIRGTKGIEIIWANGETQLITV